MENCCGLPNVNPLDALIQAQGLIPLVCESAVACHSAHLFLGSTFSGGYIRRTRQLAILVTPIETASTVLALVDRALTLLGRQGSSL